MVKTNTISHNPEEVEVIHKDRNVLVYIPKTFEASKKYAGENVDWCSVQNKEMFKKHSNRGIMYRFTFADGFQMRLTLYRYGNVNVNWSNIGMGITFVKDDLITVSSHDYHGDHNTWEELTRRINSLPHHIIETIKFRNSEYAINNWVDKERSGFFRRRHFK